MQSYDNLRHQYIYLFNIIICLHCSALIALKMNLYLILTCLIVYIYLYFILYQYLIHQKLLYIQATNIAILIGLIIGGLIFAFTTQYQIINQQIIKEIIFLVLLPPIMFQDGYNFPKRKFFQNIFYINLYGLLGTFFNFIFFWGFLYIFNEYGLIVSISNKNQPIKLYNWQILLLSACLCSIEPIVTEKVVQRTEYPKLFSVIFGESLLKDTIAITLFDSINDIVVKDDTSYDITGEDVGFIILKFLEVIACSILIGVAIGIITTIIFKNFRFLLKHKGVASMSLTILSGYIGYVLSEWAQFSGVVSMLFCGTVLSHYNVYNLTEDGKKVTVSAIQVLKITSEGMMFLLIGISIYNVQSFQSTIDQSSNAAFSPSLLGFSLLIMILGRFLNVYLTSLIGYLIIGKQKWKINMYQLVIIFLMGLVHGAVPFALCIILPEANLPSTNCIQLNIICIVLVSNLIFNLFIPKIIVLMLQKIEILEMENPHHPSVKHSFVQIKGLEHKESIDPYLTNPLLARTQSTGPIFKDFKNTTQKYWRKFQQGVLKPFLIYDYYQRKDKIKLQKLRNRIEQHEQYLAKKRLYNKVNILNDENEQCNKFIEVDFSNASDSEKDKKSQHSQKEEKKRKRKTKKIIETEIVSMVSNTSKQEKGFSGLESEQSKRKFQTERSDKKPIQFQFKYDIHNQNKINSSQKMNSNGQNQK